LRVEQVLQGLVGVVDEELLEAVLGERLEAEDVEDADGRRRAVVGAAAEARVDKAHDAVEDGRVRGLGRGVARADRVGHREAHADALAAGRDRPREQGLLESGRGDPERRGREGERRLGAGRDDGSGGVVVVVLVLGAEGDLAEVEDRLGEGES